jgi:hypothetical protein
MISFNKFVKNDKMIVLMNFKNLKGKKKGGAVWYYNKKKKHNRPPVLISINFLK